MEKSNSLDDRIFESLAKSGPLDITHIAIQIGFYTIGTDIAKDREFFDALDRLEQGNLVQWYPISNEIPRLKPVDDSATNYYSRVYCLPTLFSSNSRLASLARRIF